MKKKILSLFFVILFVSSIPRYGYSAYCSATTGNDAPTNYVFWSSGDDCCAPTTGAAFVTVYIDDEVYDEYYDTDILSIQQALWDC